MLAPSGGGLILYQAYGNLYAMTGRKAYLLEDKQIPSVGVFDEVIWKAFGGNTRNLVSFREETGKTTDLYQHLSRLCSQQLETASQITRDAVPTLTKMALQESTKYSADNSNVSITVCDKSKLSKAKDSTLSNHSAESKKNTIDPLITVTESSATNYDSADEFSVCSTQIPPLKKLDGAEPISEPKTIKSILMSKPIFKAETLKGIIITEPSSAPAKSNKSSSASKSNSAPDGKLKNVKIEDDPPLAIVMKKLNEIKLQLSKNKSSYFINRNTQQVPLNTLQNKYKTQFKINYELCGENSHLFENCYQVLFCKKYKRTDHRTCDHTEFMSSMNINQYHNGQGESSSRSRPSRPAMPFLSCIHCGYNDHKSDDCAYYPICEIWGSYGHDTHNHNRIISLRRGIKPINPQHITKNCETCGSNVHTTSDHNDIEWFRKRGAPQAKKAESFKANKTESSSALRLKTPTKSNYGVICEDRLKGAQLRAKTKIFEDY
ncbi:hypothetical protein Tco_0639171 [Tanacetum coccineum]